MIGHTLQAGWQTRLKSALGPRGGLAVIVAAHLLLIVGLSHPKLEDLADALPSEGEWAIAFVCDGFKFAQLGLIAAMAVLGCGRWFLRWPRCAMLVVWLVVAQIAGSWLLAENRDGILFKLLLMINGFAFLLFIVPLGLIRLILGRRFVLPETQLPARFQFRLVHLLLLTCEIAVLLALVRAIVPYNARWLAEVRENLSDLPQSVDWPLHVVSILAVVPAILAAALPGRILRNLLFLAAYELALAIVVTLLHTTGLPWLPSLWAEPPGIADLLWESLSAAISLCASAVTTVWLTLLAVRWLGYEFLPRPRAAA
jgi:hypothetical protein